MFAAAATHYNSQHHVVIPKAAAAAASARRLGGARRVCCRGVGKPNYATADDGGGAVLLIGFHEEEVQPLAELVGALAEEMEVSRGGDLSVARVTGDTLALSAEALLGIDNAADSSSSSSSSSLMALPPATRCVLLRGEAARALMPDLRLEMYHAGFSPSVFGAFTPAHAGKPLAHVAASVVKAHERYWDLAGDPAERARGDSGGDGDGDGDGVGPGETVAAGGTTTAVEGQDPPLNWAVSTAWDGEEAWKTADVTVAMSVAVDKATVPDPPASAQENDDDEEEDFPTREDVSNIVALDGVVGDSLRAAMLDAVTQPDWPHDTADAPPTPKWERETNDGIRSGGGGDDKDGRDGDGGAGMAGGPQLKVPPNSWGLNEEALEEVSRSAPVRAFLARLGALYPEYHVRTMPADALEPDGIPGATSSAACGGDEDGGGFDSRIATAVANAAVYGDDFQWHLDMDPASLDPTSPFAERYGLYVNRSVGRPLFVSALVYLNGPKPWTPGMDAETLFLDPGTGTGVFVRPAPGRVLLMDQDVLHRVSTPSQSAGVPRYSLVLKLCFFPKTDDSSSRLGEGGGGGGDGDGSEGEDGSGGGGGGGGTSGGGVNGGGAGGVLGVGGRAPPPP